MYFNYDKNDHRRVEYVVNNLFRFKKKCFLKQSAFASLSSVQYRFIYHIVNIFRNYVVWG